MLLSVVWNKGFLNHPENTLLYWNLSRLHFVSALFSQIFMLFIPPYRGYILLKVLENSDF